MSDRFADALRATLVDTWLQGHGRDNASMAEATASGWTRDLAEGLAASRAVGEQVIVTTTSKGGTSAAAAALDANPSKGVTAMVFVSLNFGVNTVAAWVSALSWVRTWMPFFVGIRLVRVETRSRERQVLDGRLPLGSGGLDVGAGEVGLCAGFPRARFESKLSFIFSKLPPFLNVYHGAMYTTEQGIDYTLGQQLGPTAWALAASIRGISQVIDINLNIIGSNSQARNC